MRARLHPDADRELQAAAQWYEDQVSGLGAQFLAEAIDALTDIERHPRRFARVGGRTRREIRRRLLAHFPYRVVYEVREDECVVVAVTHTSRRPGYWKDRLT
jgi:hypothetical protein